MTLGIANSGIGICVPYILLFRRCLSMRSTKLKGTGHLNEVLFCNNNFQQQRRSLAFSSIGNKNTKSWNSLKKMRVLKNEAKELEAQSLEEKLAKNIVYEIVLNSLRLDQFLLSVWAKTMERKKKIDPEDLILRGQVRINDQVATRIGQEIKKGDEIEMPLDSAPPVIPKKSRRMKGKSEMQTVLSDRVFTKIIHISEIELVEDPKTGDKIYTINARIWDEQDGNENDDD